MSYSYSGANQSIRWDKIQRYLDTDLIDILLLIDCSYTTQSGRRPTKDMLDKLPDRCTLLTSLSDHSRAELSMEPSFTTVMANVMTEQIKTHHRVVISELYKGLTSRVSHLNVHPVLLAGSLMRFIVLEKLKAPGSKEDEVIVYKENPVLTIPAGHLLPEMDSPSKRGYSSYVSSASLGGTRISPQSERDSARLVMDAAISLSRIHSYPDRAYEHDVDRGSVHSQLSSTSDERTGYAYVFTQRLINESKSTAGLEHMRDISPSELISVLKEFAGRLHEEATNFFEFALSVQMYRKSM